MRYILGFLCIVFAGFWLFGRCSGKAPKETKEALKQVTVSVKVANLRTGPGTNHDIISVNADGTGGKLQVRRGTKLDVLAESGGWFEVRIPGEERTAFIKATLCNDPTAPTGKRSGRSGKQHSPSSSGESPGTVSEPSVAPSSTTIPPNDEVVEEITTGQAQDEIIY